jgi:type I restriction enzyme S subunit
LSAITSGKFLETEAKTLLATAIPRRRFEIRSGDVLMSRANGVRALVGVACTVGTVRPRLLLPDLAFRLVPNAELLDPKFLGLTLSSCNVRQQVDAVMRGTSGQYKISQKDVRNLNIPVPALDDQRRIVAAHEAIGHRITALEQARAKSSMVEVALSASALASGLGEWPIRRLESVATVAAGVTLGSEPTGDGVIELPYLRVANVLDSRIDTADVKTVRIMRSQYARYALRRGDLLLTEGGDLDKLGRGAVWDGRIDPCLHQNHVFRVRCGDALSSDFLELYTSSPAGRAYFQSVGKQTTNLASINSTQVKNMPVPVPPRNDQDRLLAPVRAIRGRIAALSRQIEKLELVQQGVTEDLLTGRVRPKAIALQLRR